MTARGKARKRAVDILYEAEIRGVEPGDTLAQRVALADPPVNAYTSALIDGVCTQSEQIDDILQRYTEGWTVARLPDVDRAVLRVGIYELLWRVDVPDAVVIDEAVELAKTLSTDASPRFVNGVLGRVLRDRDRLAGPLELATSELTLGEDSGPAEPQDPAGGEIAARDDLPRGEDLPGEDLPG